MSVTIMKQFGKERLHLAGIIISGLFIVSSATPAFAQAKSIKWEKSIAAFEAADKKKMPKEDGVLFIGSSSIRGWKTIKQDFPKHTVINRGFGGSEIADSIHFANRIIHPYKPKHILLYAGDNDIARGKSAEIVLADFKKFARIIHEKTPKARISFIAIKPSLSRWKLAKKMEKANSLIRTFCSTDAHLSFIDIWKPMLGSDGKPKPELFIRDGLHLNNKGYALWTKIVAPHLTND